MRCANGGKPAYTVMVENIEAKIASGIMASGEKLPPLRVLAAQYHISIDMARRGIWLLRDRGLLDCRSRSGVYVSRVRTPADSELRIIAVLSGSPVGLSCSYSYQVILGAQRAALAAGIPIELRTLVDSVDKMKTLETLNGHCSGAILCGGGDEWFRSGVLHYPVAGVELHSRHGGCVSPISLDPERAAELAEDFFRRRGVRNIRILSVSDEVWKRRALVMQTHCPAAPVIWELPGSIAELGPAGTGLFFTGGSLAQAAEQFYRQQTGRSLAQDFTVLSVDGKSRLNPEFTPFATVYPDWQQVGETAFQEVMRRIRHPGVSGQRIELDVHLDED